MLFRHLHEGSLAKVKQQFEVSAATKLKKNARIKKFEPWKVVADEDLDDSPTLKINMSRNDILSVKSMTNLSQTTKGGRGKVGGSKVAGSEAGGEELFSPKS